jgi:hypothetical protein
LQEVYSYFNAKIRFGFDLNDVYKYLKIKTLKRKFIQTNKTKSKNQPQILPRGKFAAGWHMGA